MCVHYICIYTLQVIHTPTVTSRIGCLLVTSIHYYGDEGGPFLLYPVDTCITCMCKKEKKKKKNVHIHFQSYFKIIQSHLVI